MYTNSTVNKSNKGGEKKKKIAGYYLMTLGLSSLTFGLFFGLYSFVMYDDMIIALFTAAIALLYAFMMYGIFAVPLQVMLQKKARTFNVMYLLIYSVIAFIAAFLLFFIGEPASIAWTLQSYIYYLLSITAAVIYWFWDSLILYKRSFGRIKQIRETEVEYEKVGDSLKIEDIAFTLLREPKSFRFHS